MFRAGDADALAAALQALLAADPEARRRAADAAREWVAARYGWDEIARGYEAVYAQPPAADHRVASVPRPPSGEQASSPRRPFLASYTRQTTLVARRPLPPPQAATQAAAGAGGAAIDA